MGNSPPASPSGPLPMSLMQMRHVLSGVSDRAGGGARDDAGGAVGGARDDVGGAVTGAGVPSPGGGGAAGEPTAGADKASPGAGILSGGADGALDGGTSSDDCSPPPLPTTPGKTDPSSPATGLLEGTLSSLLTSKGIANSDPEL